MKPVVLFSEAGQKGVEGISAVAGTGTRHVFAIASSLAAFGQSARGAIGLATDFGDVDTADLFTEISRGIDKQLWLVESHIAPTTEQANMVGLRLQAIAPANKSNQ